MDAYKNLMVKIPSDVISPKFPFLFDELSTLYNSFSRIATSQLSVLRLKTAEEIQKINKKNTYFEKQADNLIKGVHSFINISNSVNAEGTKPHLKKLNESLQVLFESIDTIKAAIYGPRVTYDESMTKYNYLYSYAFQVKKIVTDTFEQPRSTRFNDFDYERFKELISGVTTRAISILSNGVPLSIKSPPKIALIRTNITSSCMNIRTLMESAMTFDESMSEIRSCTLEFANSLNKVFEKCAISVRIEKKTDK
jgi:hypothetical protein